MHALYLFWERCPDGVELVDHGPPRKAKARPGRRSALLLSDQPSGKEARYRTARRETLLHDVADLENPIVLRFVNADDDAALIGFLSRFGLPGAVLGEPMAKMPWVLVTEAQALLRSLLLIIDGQSPAEAMTKINNVLAQHKGASLTPRLDLAGAGGTPRLTLQPQSLYGFMVMECAMIAAHGARSTSCQHCGDLFVTGPLTGRRSHAMFCSDRCRVAAMRKRNAEKAKHGAE